MKDKTTAELIAQLRELTAELERRRYFEFLNEDGQWFVEKELKPGTYKLTPFKELYPDEMERMDKTLEAIDNQAAHIEKNPQLVAYKNVIMRRE